MKSKLVIPTALLVSAAFGFSIPEEYFNLRERLSLYFGGNSLPQQLQSQHDMSQISEARRLFGDLEESYDSEILKIWTELEISMPRELKEAISNYDKPSPFTKLNKLKEGEKFFSPSLNDKANHDVKFDTLSVPKFPDYELRVTKPNPEVLGIDTVEQYSGYLDIIQEGKHFFYWFFESRNDPANDPIILWLNGGPGCSSMTGLFFELGPSSIGPDLKPVYNPYSWNSNASVIFLDQPVGVGYSYSEGEQISSSEAAGKDVYVFLELFFTKFPSFLKNKFHIAGESYAGHYIPKFASEIISHPDRSFDLSSVLIGNGITDAKTQSASYGPMACGKGGYKQVISDEQCEKIDKMVPNCARLIQMCYDFQNAFACIPPEVYCSRLMSPYAETGLNYYDIRVGCDEGTSLCYKALDDVSEYLNLDQVKQSLGVDKVELFESCANSVGAQFDSTGDYAKPFQQYVAELLNQGIPVLLYAGDKDYICNWLGNHDWSDKLDYKDQYYFKRQPFKPWYTLTDGAYAGDAKNFGNFTFLRVFDAGHMVPYDQPSNALDMVNRWLHGDFSFGTN